MTVIWQPGPAGLPTVAVAAILTPAPVTDPGRPVQGSSMVPSCGIAERRQRMARGKVGVAFCGFSLPQPRA